MLFNLAYKKSVPIIPVTWVSLNESSIELSTVWETYQLVATISPNNATYQSVSWSSSDTSIATVDNNWLVTCVTPWTATITVTTTDGGYTATCGVEKPIDYLCFTANTAGSTIKLSMTNSSSVQLETSTDLQTWTTYGYQTITLSNVGDKVYWRNKSETNTWFSTSTNYFYYEMSWSIAASWDVNYLLNKNSTTTVPDYAFRYLFRFCSSSLTTAPKLPGTVIGSSSYYFMFAYCSNLTTLPILPATTLPWYCYCNMFYECPKIKLSETQTWEYQTPYRIPSEWTWTAWWYSLDVMFANTWWTFTSTPSINTTYYTSNTVV